MGPEIAPSPPPQPPAPRSPRRLTRSTRERMWAGVAGGMAEYFDLDPSLVRLIWVAAAVVSHGLAIPLYFLAWIILPRDDRPASAGQTHWRDWSQEFHAETQRLAEEARRVTNEFTGSQPESTPTNTPTSTPASNSASTSTTAAAPEPAQAATDKGPIPRFPPEPNFEPDPNFQPAPSFEPRATETPAWSAPSPTDLDEPRRNGRQPRSVGVVLVGLGAFLLAANAGWFAWFNWGSMWPLIFIVLGVLLLARQFDWRGR